MAKKDMGDSGVFGDKKTMKTIPNSNTKLTGIAKAKSVGGKAVSGGIPSVPSIQADTMHGNTADDDAINQGALKGQKGLSVRRTSDGYMKKK